MEAILRTARVYGKSATPLRAEPTLTAGVKRMTAGNDMETNTMGRFVLLWLLGVPIPILVLIWALGGLH
jgi:hypothetical protein